jgi:hypothetical protein
VGIGREEFGGGSADEPIRRPLDEHRRAAAVAAVKRYRESDPHGWYDYVAEANELAAADAQITDD